ncbi:MAG: hypothetical protein FJX59_08665 [Alphaproteobacteria bacterium]|nr:hypothetical protein [Alphaproteobacteria bacterium]
MSKIISLLVLALFATPVAAAPGYFASRAELEQVLADIIAWLPGSWDSYPQIHMEHHDAMPAEGEHEHWHRTFVRIDAPQVGEVVFYGQVNAGGRDGPIVAGSQVLYKAVIDERLGAVNILGQGPLDPEKYENLHDRPELWGEVKMREPEAINCDFIWRRDGAQVFAVLQGNTPDKQKYGPGTCAFISKRTDAEFRADAEWVLSAENFWLYDNNWMDDRLFLGREDRTHIRLFRSRPYQCTVKDAAGTRKIDGHDRGTAIKARTKDGKDLDVLLVRANFPAGAGKGLSDRMKLLVTDAKTKAAIGAADKEPLASRITLTADGVSVRCARQEKFPPMHPPES